MNEKLPIEFKEREKERTSSTRNRFPRMDHGGVPSVSREPVHRYQRKTPVSSSLFSRTRPRGRGRIAWRICHVCPVLPFPRVASGIEEHPWLWCKRSCRIESTLFSLSLWNREKVRRAVLGRDGRSFEWKVREERGMIAPQAMIRHTHIRIYDFRTCPPEGLFIGGHESLPPLSVSLSLVTRLMVNGSTGNPLKTSRRKTRDGIDRGENWRRIDCYPATDANLSTWASR